uniref:Uncharacterized protein AlNc14C11G1337 n=1 Tax=Albugo laibachii Nc14 TaxID=890382 RepID=F0W2V9_9STRA|nr:conserved hypothetical protein [Albugo laibachii Nc14]|eukprot:CCA15395.1 conserved hypothetical protein [Albugo laibachii Nc14]
MANVVDRYLTQSLCIIALIAVYLCASGLIHVDEVFFSESHRHASLQTGFISLDSKTTQNGNHDTPYDRMVFVLVDALRADMVLGKDKMYEGDQLKQSNSTLVNLERYMEYTHGLIAKNRALAYVAEASIPTGLFALHNEKPITMPRLKALMTGRSPAFIDILKNFNSVALQENNLIEKLYKAGKKIVFYGDDTWLRLFPDYFMRHDGTSSFFTRDTVEVDWNVTRHLQDELDPAFNDPKSKDWDVLILHYLGVDHVGHLRGPRSKMMEVKLVEMDSVIRTLHENIQLQDKKRQSKDPKAKSTLVVLCSDHGMSEVGNHGGSSIEESSALILFLYSKDDTIRHRNSEKLITRKLQIDLAPTLSVLLDVDIPDLSGGLLIKDVIEHASNMNNGSGDNVQNSDIKYQLNTWIKNYQQLYTLAVELFPDDREGLNYRREALLKSVKNAFRSNERSALDEELTHVQTETAQLQDLILKITATSATYNKTSIYTGITLLFLCTFIEMRRVRRRSFRSINSTSFTAACCLVQYMSLASSSLIENEHATSFCLVCTLLMYQFFQQVKINGVKDTASKCHFTFIMAMILIRLLRMRNQVANYGRLNGVVVDIGVPGNEFAENDSLSILSTAPIMTLRLLWLYYVVIWTLLCLRVQTVVWRHTEPTTKERFDPTRKSYWLIQLTCFTVAQVCSFCTHWHLDNPSIGDSLRWRDPDMYARLVYYATVVSLITWLFQVFLRLYTSQNMKEALRQDFLAIELAMWPVVQLVLRSAHLPTLAVLSVLLWVIPKVLRVIEKSQPNSLDVESFLAIFSVLIAQVAFFALGNSHLVSTVDISQAYHGLSAYSQVLVGGISFINVFCGPILCFLNFAQWLLYFFIESKPNPKVLSCHRTIMIVFGYQTLRFGLYSAIVYWMRFHLFIWSVFAPKLLYEIAYSSFIYVFLFVLSSLLGPVGVEETDVRTQEEVHN